MNDKKSSLPSKAYHGQLWTFPGGIHPDDRKDLSRQAPVKQAGIPPRLYLSFPVYGDHALTPTVKVGDSVLKGQIIAASDDKFCPPLHASSSGKIIGIEPRTTTHASQLKQSCIVIDCDGEDTWCERKPVSAPEQADKDTLIHTIAMAGIVGLGGAMFPTHIKLSTHEGIDTLIINGAECEPYITCDDRLMTDRAEDVIKGIALVQRILSPKKTLIAIEDNKKDAIAAIDEALKNSPYDIEYAVIPTKYPSGGEKQLIQIVSGKEVPAGDLPSSIGVVMQNVGTCYAIKKAVWDGEPSVSRIITLTGEALGTPGNYEALIGTPVSCLLAEANIDTKSCEQLILGGPMMGVQLPHDDIGIGKEANCIIAARTGELNRGQQEQACIRCGQCTQACPASLLPQQLYWFARSKEFDKAREHHLFDCIECGACAYVCPSDIPLVQYYRHLKSEIRARDAEQKKSDHAKKRFEFRNFRIEREKTERAEKHRLAAEERKKRAQQQGSNDANKQAIQDALKRVQAKKKQNTENKKS